MHSASLDGTTVPESVEVKGRLFAKDCPILPGIKAESAEIVNCPSISSIEASSLKISGSTLKESIRVANLKAEKTEFGDVTVEEAHINLCVKIKSIHAQRLNMANSGAGDIKVEGSLAFEDNNGVIYVNKSTSSVGEVIGGQIKYYDKLPWWPNPNRRCIFTIGSSGISEKETFASQTLGLLFPPARKKH